MIVQPKIRGFICTTAHPVGCAAHVQEQIDYLKRQPAISNGPKNVLVIGASTGYGLASRIVSAFGGSRASTVGVFFEKEAEPKRTATAGWYNSVAFEQKAKAEGIYARSLNGDAFADSMKQAAVDLIKRDLKKVDLVVYSLASPRRQHPKTGEISKSVLKPIGHAYSNYSLDLSTNNLEQVSLPEATEEEIRQTISVMGGEDWQMWMDALEQGGVLADGVKAVAYSYIGPEVTHPIYRNGTIGRAKDHLEMTAKTLNERLKKYKGQAWISVNKALVTQSSSAIPFIPLYFVILKKIMNDKKIEEGCIEQIYRLFATRLYEQGKFPTDANGFIRMDDWEMRADVQSLVKERWENISQENLRTYADIEGYSQDFLKLFGFGIKGVDYNADVETELKLASL